MQGWCEVSHVSSLLDRLTGISIAEIFLHVGWEIPTSSARPSPAHPGLLIPFGIPSRLVASDVLLHLLLEFKGIGLMSRKSAIKLH